MRDAGARELTWTNKFLGRESWGLKKNADWKREGFRGGDDDGREMGAWGLCVG